MQPTQQLWRRIDSSSCRSLSEGRNHDQLPPQEPHNFPTALMSSHLVSVNKPPAREVEGSTYASSSARTSRSLRDTTGVRGEGVRKVLSFDLEERQHSQSSSVPHQMPHLTEKTRPSSALRSMRSDDVPMNLP